MFIKNKVVDIEKIKKVLNIINQYLTYESLKKDFESVKNNTSEFDFNRVYEITFRYFLGKLSLAELEYIRDNNMFNFNSNSIFDFRRKKVLDEKILEYNSILKEVYELMQKDRLGNYFESSGGLLFMFDKSLVLETILDLDNDKVVLTSDGLRLKSCINNIKNLFFESEKGEKNDNIVILPR